MKTILLIRYALDNLYKIHERADIELFIERRFTFYQHPVDVKARLRQPRQSSQTSKREKYAFMCFFFMLVSAFQAFSMHEMECGKHMYVFSCTGSWKKKKVALLCFLLANMKHSCSRKEEGGGRTAALHFYSNVECGCVQCARLDPFVRALRDK